jgi:hypothetical protein
LEKIFAFCSDKNSFIKKISILSLASLFIDLIPEYKIDLDKYDKNIKVKII